MNNKMASDKKIYTENAIRVPIAVYAVVCFVDNSAGTIAVFRDTYEEAAQWLHERVDVMKSYKYFEHEGFQATLENNILTTKGESVMFPESTAIYRIEGMSLAMVLNYMLERGLGYERIP
jgi:hypothetical protein